MKEKINHQDITNITALSIYETIELVYFMRDLINRGKILEALEICHEISDSLIMLKEYLQEEKKE